MKALEVHNLRKEFTRRDGRGKRRVAALKERRLRDRARRVRRHPGPERLGQVDARPPALDAAAPGRRQRDASSATTRSRTPARCARLVNRVSVEASFFKKMRAAENLSYAARFYGLRPHETKDADPGDPDARRLPCRPPRRADGEPLARDAAEGRARARAADLAGPAAARRADDRPRPALEAGGAGVHPRGARRARRDGPALHARPGRGRDASPTASGSSTTASCSASSRPTS